MDQRPPPFEFILEAFVDPSSVRDVVRGMSSFTLHAPRFTRHVVDAAEPCVFPMPPLRARRGHAARGMGERVVAGSAVRLAPLLLAGLDLTLPHVPDAELETLIDQRTAALARQLDAERSSQPHGGNASSSSGGGGRGQIAVLFFEKRRRKNWFAVRGEEEICWESWTVKVAVAEPRTESGGFRPPGVLPPGLPLGAVVLQTRQRPGRPR